MGPGQWPTDCHWPGDVTRDGPNPKVNDPIRTTDSHAECFTDLVRWRRDVRRFKSDAVPETTIDQLLALADLSPSVGNSQPWRIVRVKSQQVRSAMRQNFETANAAASIIYTDPQQRSDYLALKLAGFDAAPEHIAILSDHESDQGQGLGRQTMPEMLDYSCVSFVTTLWYAARAHGLGMGWVSILDPNAAKSLLSVPENWHLIAYLLIGYAQEHHLDPELERHGWQPRTPRTTRSFDR